MQIFHNTPDQALQVDLFPYSFGLYCPHRFWVESGTSHAQRAPKQRFMSCYWQDTRQSWSKPKERERATIILLFLHPPGHPHHALPYAKVLNLCENTDPALALSFLHATTHALLATHIEQLNAFLLHHPSQTPSTIPTHKPSLHLVTTSHPQQAAPTIAPTPTTTPSPIPFANGKDLELKKQIFSAFLKTFTLGAYACETPGEYKVASNAKLQAARPSAGAFKFAEEQWDTASLFWKHMYNPKGFYDDYSLRFSKPPFVGFMHSMADTVKEFTGEPIDLSFLL